MGFIMILGNLLSSFNSEKELPVKTYTYHSKEVMSEAVKLRLSGLKIKEIADQLGICKSAVQRFCSKSISEDKMLVLTINNREAALITRNNDRVERHEEIKKILASGKEMSNRAIAIILDVTSTTINRDMKLINDENKLN